MKFTIKDLCKKLKLDFSGNSNTEISYTCGVEQLQAGGLAYIANPAELANLPTPKGIFNSRRLNLDDYEISPDAAIIVPANSESSSHNLIFSNDPINDHAKAAELLYDAPNKSEMIHSNACVSENTTIGKAVTIDANSVIYDDVVIGDHTVIRSGTVIMEKTVIGKNCLIYPNVTIREGCWIGDNVIIHPAAVIGADGFGFYQRGGRNLKIPQVGGVIIEDDVEIGACTTIDRARFTNTIIRKGCKLDNLIHIAHNVDMGEYSLMAAQSGIAGSSKVGHHLMMGGQSGIKDNLKIGDNVTLLARTLITSKTDDNAMVAGMPSRPIKVWRQIQALINNLDGLFERMKKIERLLHKQEKDT